MDSCFCHLELKNLAKTFKIKQSTLIQICAELKTVDCFIKPAWLCDLITSKDINMKILLDNLYQSNFLLSKLHVLDITGDILVVNLKTFLSQVNTLVNNLESITSRQDTTPIFLVLNNNITSTIIGNKIKDKIKIALNVLTLGINNYCKTGEVKYLCFNMEDMTPTIFGIALGYPVVYIQENVHSNIVPDMLELHVIETKIKLIDFPCTFCIRQKLTSEVIYSFSIPKDVEMFCEDHVKIWKRKIHQSKDSNLIISTSEKHLEITQVIL